MVGADIRLIASGEKEMSDERPVSTVPHSQSNTLRLNKSGSAIQGGGGVQYQQQPQDNFIVYVNQTIQSRGDNRGPGGGDVGKLDQYAAVNSQLKQSSLLTPEMTFSQSSAAQFGTAKGIGLQPKIQ